jgi:hypothetical protein
MLKKIRNFIYGLLWGYEWQPWRVDGGLMMQRLNRDTGEIERRFPSADEVHSANEWQSHH